MKRPLALLGALAATVSLAACGADTAGGDAAGPPRSGGTLRYGLSLPPTCSDPAQSGTNQTIYVTRQIVDSLVDQDPATGEIEPWLAEGWTIGPEARSFTFRLREGITFSDGTPLTADSVRKNFDAIVHTLGGSKASLAASYLAGYTGTTVVDPRTARVEFAAPNAQFLQAASTPQLGILSDADTAKSADDRCLGTNIGSGPFTYAEYKQGASVTLAKRTGYRWGSPVFANHGDAYLDRIAFTVVPESGVRTGSLSSGQLDAVSDALPQDVPQIEAAGGRVLFFANPGIPFGLQPNVTRGPLRDPAVRTALRTAIDRKELVDTVLGPRFKPATSTLASSTPGHVDLSAQLGYDPEAARRTLDAAGWRPGPDGIRVRGGQRLSFGVLLSAVFAGNQAILELVQQQVRKVGIDLRLDLVAQNEATARQNTRDYDVTYYNTTRADGDILRTTFGLDQRNLNARSPIPPLDQVLAAEVAATDAAARAELIGQAQRLVLDEGLWIPTTELSQAIGAADTVADLKFEASGRLQFHDAWLTGR
ncbi:ABC transporter substrate-binding protein [Nocardia sp. CDC159]|uniref:ABC transporter substrate-binding protein n=1 Tax=Nocardia pulmonis TaxID=2951408 RepID=A0A9X2E3X2_9NOCA|nr:MULTISPECIES: ABC transporter substrate-binding protein [Nocardia]MCM6772623.1 ABC transporter substrate-binding protein [Nocardia pulmonis]MCM6786074.1 ABC transporter substrate-binding protein [Nocardia sp. CDC159]